MSDRSELPSFVKGLPVTREALQFARRLHGQQRRESDRARFILHPLEVASLLYNTGAPDEVVAAAVLHDAIEHAGADPDEIRRRFGDRVAGLVDALTEDDSIESYEQRKQRLSEQ